MGFCDGSSGGMCKGSCDVSYYDGSGYGLQGGICKDPSMALQVFCARLDEGFKNGPCNAFQDGTCNGLEFKN